MFAYQTGWHNAQTEKVAEKRKFHMTAATLRASLDRHVERNECDKRVCTRFILTNRRCAEIGGIMGNDHTRRLDKIYLSKTRVSAIQNVLLVKLC